MFLEYYCGILAAVRVIYIEEIYWCSSERAAYILMP